MKAQNLIASVAAVLFTFASLSAVNYNVERQPAPAAKASAVPVINLAPVQVRPSAAEMRSAALLSEIGVAGIATTPAMRRLEDPGNTEQFSLLGSQLVMPYYAFGNKFGRIAKE
ncbi:hypothetical protein RHOFW510R12_05390 [Rhodanobacter sp. FW510-R12]|uniref:hypothetical protein n=2 Tax=Pseudomonadota TaxID=1224 RepID=UPI0007A9F199|nr:MULTISPECIES: hypothetical protein [unclassified Rhodanobacter]KZC15875.1 hypothetical protein RHOFW104R8_02710 [Rhodanobacter sp. FW104-R8]KZC28479.1 hypothetical protein RhoFW510T8_11495 [Rhodanobacter sp. FW510-T8]KZC32502.1 hypothetical protein RhoFW510R10_12595 [Rhodanobacter sp. FW510-R10]